MHNLHKLHNLHNLHCLTKGPSVTATRTHRSDPRYTWVRLKERKMCVIQETGMTQLGELWIRERERQPSAMSRPCCCFFLSSAHTCRCTSSLHKNCFPQSTEVHHCSALLPRFGFPSSAARKPTGGCSAPRLITFLSNSTQLNIHA